jgi:hypothetical protein
MDTSPRDGDRFLSQGAHLSPDDGMCLMEAVSRAAHLPWSDAPECTHPLLAHLARLVNDASSDDGRQQLSVLIPALADVRPDSAAVSARVAEACSAAALRRHPTRLLIHLHRVAAAQLVREEQMPAPAGVLRRVRRTAFARGPAARAVEASVAALLHLPVPERDPALRELLVGGLAGAGRGPQASSRAVDGGRGDTEDVGQGAQVGEQVLRR